MIQARGLPLAYASSESGYVGGDDIDGEVHYLMSKAKNRSESETETDSDTGMTVIRPKVPARRIRMGSDRSYGKFVRKNP